MIRNYLLAFCLILGCSMIMNGQTPCSDFNATTSPAGNWAPSPYPNGNVSVNFGSPNALDGSQYLILGDQSGGSWYENSTDFRSLGKKYLGQCLYFDFYLKNDSGYGQPYHPYITLSNGVHNASFRANVTVTPGSGWVRIKAPIQLSSGGILPSNSEGTWVLNTAGTSADFDNLIMNSTTLAITPDITSTQQEIVFFDNICVKPCDGCTADFTLSTSFSTLNNTATATINLINPILYSTPGNPGPTYIIDWGDGSSSNYIYPTVSHTYNAAGSYTICVSENQGRISVCKRCFTFCYKPSIPTFTNFSTVDSPTKGMEAIIKAELQSAESKDFTLVPNPAKTYVDLETRLLKRELVTVRIIDNTGKVVIERSENLNSGTQFIRLDTQKLMQGAYLVEMKSDTKVSTQKLLISK
ncbi:T9SS type A sorting domain-containing protein [Chryseobacterium sp. Tr-659]|uniref:T9SS type A sorting domain-containing protein n=1 Tax=Chryseobacterium sp. Tr-659 TaxID=2608340 RepID=UPI00141EFA67|nr:T9SS type A sorting domain-containing protein [Chryseobacterium sp. Tr-659]NIF04851.1 T9SS type A sorting domain-containing protein [Chryseobacterium sp. Tr-659]